MPTATLTWREGEQEAVRSVEELDQVLDRLEAQARAEGGAMCVEIEREGGEGSLDLVVGAEVSWLQHLAADGSPPYLVSRGDEGSGGMFVFFHLGHWSEVPRTQSITPAVAREAARVFLRTGKPWDGVSWDEV